MRKSIASLSLASLILAASCDIGPRELRLVSPALPVDRGIAEDLSNLLDTGSSVRITLTQSELAGEAALDAIASGDADIALVSNHLPFRDDIATVMPLYPTVLHIAKRADNDAPLGPDMFRNARIFAGKQGSASRLVFERIVQRMDLAASEYSYTDNPDDMPDIVVVFAPISPQQAAKFSERLVLTSLGTPAQIGAGGFVDAAVLMNPHLRTFVIPFGVYGDATPEPIVTVAVDKILVARNDLDRSVVYDLINEVLRLRPALAAKRPGLFQQLSEDFDASRSRFILHAGTQAYLQRSAPSIYERYSGVAEVAVTLIVALASAVFAGIRIFRIRRKNRIDRYYAAAIEVRNSITNLKGPAEYQQAVAKVRELQDEAFDLLVDEKLAADESFRIFITLSNDILRQLGAPGLDGHLSDD